MANDKGGARSYKGSVINDSLNLTINIKWLLQIFVLIGMIVYGWYQLENRIQDLERKMVLAMEEIDLHNEERKLAEEKHIAEMEERMLWYESELNLNPFSWGKKKKK
tara:strand:- start:2475 stop:2795 length:321 start_codon:yes stop_codon:yes gene_type:complete